MLDLEFPEISNQIQFHVPDEKRETAWPGHRGCELAGYNKIIWMHPFLKFVSEYSALYQQGRKIPLGGISPAPKPVIAADAPTVLIFSPHPDDECIIGALPLRLLREAGMRVINVAVTQGSKKERQAGRLQELKEACSFMGFELIQTRPNGLER